MKVYNALVLPVLLYNCATWGVTDAVMEKLEAFHRRHLREVIGVRKRELRNEELYEKCGEKNLKEDITRGRWELFGHVLRLNRQTPAQIAMDYVLYSVERRGKRTAIRHANNNTTSATVQ